MIRLFSLSAYVAVTLSAGCKTEEHPPSGAEESGKRAAPAPKRKATAYSVNRAQSVLEEHGVSTTGMKPGEWSGHWVGDQKLLGPMTGNMGVDMTVTQDADGVLHGVQSALGVTVELIWAPSPDQPGLAAGTNYERRPLANGVTFSFHNDVTAVVSGDDLTLAVYTETDDAGTYNGQAIPKTPPQTSLFVLHRAKP